MSIIEVEEELVSTVDLNVDLTKDGLRVSVYIDDIEVHDFVAYDTIAYTLVSDRDKYPSEILERILMEFRNMADIMEQALDDESGE